MPGVDLTEVQPTVFAVLQSITDQDGVAISYASMTNPGVRGRTVFPHPSSIGRRWHVRAWCARRQDFRDFTLGRIRSALPVHGYYPQDD